MTAHEGSSPLARGGQRLRAHRRQRPRLIPARAGRTVYTRDSGSSNQAHPRSRGADLVDDGGTRTTLGSSPLARGGRATSRPPRARERLIPARAGRTRRTSPASGPCGAHPRSRGADLRRRSPPCPGAGSSPLARGGRRNPPRRNARRRLIPARAGRTSKSAMQPPRAEAHPRSRGADTRRSGATVSVWGSSPLARGGRLGLLGPVEVLGLIPARAGRTTPGRCTRPARPAHPRSRGADAMAAEEYGAKLGSSPLARGGHPRPSPRPTPGGLIPARAGRTGTVVSAVTARPAHPRSRGADVRAAEELEAARGSSPLARGGPGGAHRGEDGGRLIPARAGRTSPSGSAGTVARAHPRSRGADGRGGPRQVRVTGSSPLARGGPARVAARLLARRLIPARAGRT